MKLRLDLVVVSGLIAASFLAWLSFEIKPLWGFLLFALFPMLYMGMRSRKPWKRIFEGSLVLGLLLGIFFDLFQSFNNVWVVNLVIPWRILGVLPVDNILGYFLMTLLVITFYEHFFLQSSKGNFGARFYKVFSIILGVTFCTLALFHFLPGLFLIPYSYFIGGLLAVILTVIALIRHPENINSSLRMAGYFSIVWFCVELVALATKGWSFPGEYVGWIAIGGLGFPFEELLFWMFWYAPFLIVAYSYLIREKKEL